MHYHLLVAGEGELHELLEPFADYEGEGTNPNAKFDWFQPGGQFKNSIPLRQPRKRLFLGFIPGIPTSRVQTALKSEVDVQALIAAPPAALLFQKQWSPSEFFPEVNIELPWESVFKRIFAEIPDSTLLRSVDCHS